MSVRVKKYEDIMNEGRYIFGNDVDLREGSLCYMVMSATAVGMAQLYEELKLIEENAYASTATGKELDLCVEMLGLERKNRKNAVVRIEGDAGFEVGDIFTLGELEYAVIDTGDTYYIAKCTTAGEAGNVCVGNVTPKKDFGEWSGKIVELIEKGGEKESDEELRRRYYERIRCPILPGNVSYYREIIKDIPGVGGIKVLPAPEGAGTVLVVITDSEYNVAGENLISYVKEKLDPEMYEGQGMGLLPLGHSVKVESVEKVDITIQVEIFGREGGENAYFAFLNGRLAPKIKEMNLNWCIEQEIVIWDRIIEDYLLTLGGVRDVNVISINGEPNRFRLGEKQIIGEVKFIGC